MLPVGADALLILDDYSAALPHASTHAGVREKYMRTLAALACGVGLFAGRTRARNSR